MDISTFGIFKNLSLIHGEWVASTNSKKIDVLNPVDQSLIATIPALEPAQITAAIESSEQALGAWKAHSVKQRSDILKKWYALIIQHQDELATIMTVEQGKPLHEAKGEVNYAASFIEWFAEEGRRMNGDTIPAASKDKRIMTKREPVGE